MTSRRSVSGGVVASLVTCALFACSYRDNDDHDDNNFRADVIECEDALDRLRDCCPDFEPTLVQCDFDYKQTVGCGSSSTTSVHPAFSVDESRCIRDTTCDELQASGVCTRAQAARAYSVSDDEVTPVFGDASTSHVVMTHAAVCP